MAPTHVQLRGLARTQHEGGGGLSTSKHFSHSLHSIVTTSGPRGGGGGGLEGNHPWLDPC